jgi:kynurenine formamidase
VTYVETGGHLFADGPALDQLPLERLFPEAEVWSCEVRDREILPPAGAEPHDMRDKALIVLCGWHRHWSGDAAFATQSPWLGPDLQEAVMTCRPSVLAGDAVSFDPPDAPEMPFLRRYFRTGGIIVSPLVPREELPARGRLILAPLNLAGTNSSPCRVFLEV